MTQITIIPPSSLLFHEGNIGQSATPISSRYRNNCPQPANEKTLRELRMLPIGYANYRFLSNHFEIHVPVQ